MVNNCICIKLVLNSNFFLKNVCKFKKKYLIILLLKYQKILTVLKNIVYIIILFF